MSIKLTALFLLIATVFVSANARAAPDLTLPIDCTLGTDCWIVNYMDTNPAIDIAQDFTCAARTYDAHKGTDIAIRDILTMEQGMNVLAAADGKVLRLRDGVDDEILNREALEEIKNDKRGCGNGVFIDHGDGWQTIYCHMKKDSIKVKQRQSVKQGDILGQVGHSGFVEFPHIHLGVFFENTAIDPFTGHDDTDGCLIAGQKPLWSSAANLQYQPLSIYAGGFSSHVPDFEAIKIDASSPAHLSINAPALIFWASVFGIEKGDAITIEIRDPLGRIFAKKEQTQEINRARQFYYIGKKTAGGPLINGTYKAIIQISRNMDNPPNITEEYELDIPVQ